MIDLAGLCAYTVTVWAALLHLDYLAHRRRIADQRERAAAYRQRAAHIQTLKGTTP